MALSPKLMYPGRRRKRERGAGGSEREREREKERYRKREGERPNWNCLIRGRGGVSKNQQIIVPTHRLITRQNIKEEQFCNKHRRFCNKPRRFCN